MKYRHIDWRPAKRLMVHGGLWTDMNLPRFHVGWEEGCEYLAFDYGNEGADPVIGVSLDLAGTRVGRVLGEVGWRFYRWRRGFTARALVTPSRTDRQPPTSATQANSAQGTSDA